MVNYRACMRMARVALLAASLALAAAEAARAQECALALTHPWPTAASAPPPPSAGPRIRSIRFRGQRGLTASALRARMEMKPARFWRSSRRSLYSEQAWTGDHRRLCDLYRDAGYVTASLGPPEVVAHAKPSGPAEVSLSIPVREGPRYRLGGLQVEGVTGWDPSGDAETFDLRPGDVYRHGRVLEGLDTLRRAAGRQGHAAWSALITFSPRPGPELFVDVTAQVQEGLPWLVGRIVFRGAPRTRDLTLRRVVVLDEGDLFDSAALDESVRRLDVLGYVRVRDVEVAPSAAGGPYADLTFVMEERPVLRYGLSGGINALEGASLAAEVGEVNAFGRGERLSAAVQAGEDVRAYELSAAFPFVFGTSWTAGVELRRRELDLQGVPEGGVPPHTRDEDALRVFAQRALGPRTSLGVGYSLADVTLRTESGPAPAGFGQRRDGRLALSVRYDGWDHGWKPRQGLRLEGRARGWGGLLGGAVDAIEMGGAAFGFLPLGRRAALGAGAHGGFIRSGRGPAELPFDERYLLGGEAGLRGFDARSVGPRDPAGALVAGTRFLVLQAEAHADVTPGVRTLAFVDAGHAWAAGADTGRLRVSTGLEVRFEVPVIHLPLRLIAAHNAVRDPFHPRGSFRVAVGPVP